MRSLNIQKWQTEYPGPGETLDTLRTAVAHAEAVAFDSRADFDDFDAALRTIASSMADLPMPLHRRHQALKRAHQVDTRHLTAALLALRAAFSAEQAAEAKKPSQSEPKPVVVLPPRTQCQTISVDVLPDGEIKHRVTPESAFFLAPNRLDDTAKVIRQFGFQREILPDCYNWVAVHQGVTYGPTDSFSITYSRDEFERLCRLEVTSGSPYVLDGVRLGYKAFESVKKLQEEFDNYEEDQEKG